MAGSSGADLGTGRTAGCCSWFKTLKLGIFRVQDFGV